MNQVHWGNFASFLDICREWETQAWDHLRETYRVTIQVVPNLPLTPRQRLRFSTWASYKNGTLVLMSIYVSRGPSSVHSISVNGATVLASIIWTNKGIEPLTITFYYVSTKMSHLTNNRIEPLSGDPLTGLECTVLRYSPLNFTVCCSCTLSHRIDTKRIDINV